jgi:hypothetical protein
MHIRTMGQHSDADTSTIIASPFEVSTYYGQLNSMDKSSRGRTRCTVVTEFVLVDRNTLTATCEVSAPIRLLFQVAHPLRGRELPLSIEDVRRPTERLRPDINTSPRQSIESWHIQWAGP